MLVTVDQVVAHIVGDYFIQSDWMASEKTKNNVACLAHAFIYAMPFLLLGVTPSAFTMILLSHFLIDRYRLARYVCWAKNFLAPKRTFWMWDESNPKVAMFHLWWRPWKDCKNSSGYPPELPAWMATWLMIIVDNTLHVLINALSIKYL